MRIVKFRVHYRVSRKSHAKSSLSFSCLQVAPNTHRAECRCHYCNRDSHAGKLRSYRRVAADIGHQKSLVAPADGYLDMAVATFDCEHSSRIVFLLPEGSNRSRRLSLKLLGMCQGRPVIGIDFRIGTEPTIRTLFGTNES